MEQARKEKLSAKRAMEMLEGMLSKKSLLVVEGMHDIKALKCLCEMPVLNMLTGSDESDSKLDVNAVSYDAFMKDGSSLDKYNRIYIFMDNDKNGEEKAMKAAMHAYERSECEVDVETGKRLLKMLRIKHVEEIKRPIEKILGD